MPTKNRRAAVYLPPDVDEALAIFKDNRRIDGDSAALIAILREFFELGATKAHRSSPDLEDRISSLEQSEPVLQSRVQSLERTVEYLFAKLQSLHDVATAPPSANVAQTSSSVPSGELSSELLEKTGSQRSATQAQLDLDEAVRVEAEVETMFLTRKALAERFGLTDSQFGRRKDGYDGMPLEEWSRAADPEGVAWTRDSISKKYRPLPE